MKEGLAGFSVVMGGGFEDAGLVWCLNLTSKIKVTLFFFIVDRLPKRRFIHASPAADQLNRLTVWSQNESHTTSPVNPTNRIKQPVSEPAWIRVRVHTE